MNDKVVIVGSLSDEQVQKLNEITAAWGAKFAWGSGGDFTYNELWDTLSDWGDDD